MRTSTGGTARAGRDILTGRTAAVAAAAADTGADTPPEQAEEAAEAAGTERHARHSSSKSCRSLSAGITNCFDYDYFSCLCVLFFNLSLNHH